MSTVILVGVADNVESKNRKKHVNCYLNTVMQQSNYRKLLMNKKTVKAWTLFFSGLFPNNAI